MAATTIDPVERASFNRLADTWWDEDGPMWPLHRLNDLRTRYLAARLREFWPERTAERPLAGLDVLDIGCGAGLLSESAAALGGRVHGVDVAERNVAIAHRHARNAGFDISYEHGAAELLLDRPRRYDLVLNMEVVEHVADLPAFMSACCELTRPGGIMVIATINRTIASWISAIVGAEYILRWLPRGTHQWRRFPKPGELERMLAESGFGVRDRIGVRVNPVTRAFRLSDNLSVNYMLIAQRRAEHGRDGDRPAIGNR